MKHKDTKAGDFIKHYSKNAEYLFIYQIYFSKSYQELWARCVYSSDTHIISVGEIDPLSIFLTDFYEPIDDYDKGLLL